MLVGTNVAKDCSADLPYLRANGYNVLRIVLDQAYQDRLPSYLNRARELGFTIEAQITKESWVYTDAFTWYATIRWWTDFLGDWVEYWAVGNEADNPDPNTQSSWVLQPWDLTLLLWGAHACNGYVIVGGQSSGSADYLDKVDVGGAKAIAVHAWGVRPSDDWPGPDWGFNSIQNLVSRFTHFGLPIWVDEFGPYPGMDVDPNEYVSRMVNACSEIPEVAACLSFGLVGGNSWTP